MQTYAIMVAVFLVCGCIGGEFTAPEAAKPNTTDCSKVSQTDRDLCYQNAAISVNNVSICTRIMERDIRDYCRARILQDESLCRSLKSPDRRDWCLRSVGSFAEEIAPN